MIVLAGALYVFLPLTFSLVRVHHALSAVCVVVAVAGRRISSPSDLPQSEQLAAACTALLPQHAFNFDAQTDTGRALLQQLAATTLRSKLVGLAASPLAALAVSARTGVQSRDAIDVHCVTGGALSDAVLVQGACVRTTSHSLAAATSAAVAFEGPDAELRRACVLYIRRADAEPTRAIIDGC